MARPGHRSHGHRKLGAYARGATFRTADAAEAASRFRGHVFASIAAQDGQITHRICLYCPARPS